MSYHHLNLQEREIIGYMRNIEKATMQSIATFLHVSKSTISRELNRNSVDQRDSMWLISKKYIPSCANDFAKRRRIDCVKTKLTQENLNIIKNGLLKDHSPEQISGVQTKINSSFPTSRTIYNYIYDGKVQLPKNFRLKLKKRDNKRNSPIKNKILYCKTIHERPEYITKNHSFGHWEIDLIESAGNGGYIITFVERLTRFIETQYIDTKHAININKFIKKMKKKYKVNSITTDNGSEFHKLYKFTFFDNIRVYYTDPGAPYQKGLVEETNKLIREYIPKFKVFDKTITRPLKVFTQKINSRPKKVLNFLSPQFTFNELSVIV